MALALKQAMALLNFATPEHHQIAAHRDPVDPLGRISNIRIFLLHLIELSWVGRERLPEHPDSGFNSAGSASQRMSELVG